MFRPTRLAVVLRAMALATALSGFVRAVPTSADEPAPVSPDAQSESDDSGGAGQPSSRPVAGTVSAYDDLERLPGTSDNRIRKMWEDGLRSEREGQFLAAARAYEAIAQSLPLESQACWRVAKAYWDLGRGLPDSEEGQRAEYLASTEQWADRGLAVDPECGECYLYKVAGMGGLLQAQGTFAAARHAAEIAAFLQRGIEILSRRPDHMRNPELEELYYAAARFYRSVPDFFLMQWVLGVRGNRQRAVEYMRKANQIAMNIAGERPQFMVELGASLLCLGQEDDSAALVAEGLGMLDRVRGLNPAKETSSAELRHAQILIADPTKACDYSREQWIERPPDPAR